MDTTRHPQLTEREQRNALFSPEEQKVLQECNREAFYQRSLPFGTACGIGTWYAIQRGLLKPNVRFGAAPKVMLGVTIGYFVGKVSYQNRCAEKIMQIPNSRLADIIRQRRQGAAAGVERLIPEQGGFGAGSMLSPFGPAIPSDSVTEERLRDSDSLNMDIPQYSGLDDSGRPTVDSTLSFEDDLQLPPNPPVSKTYEELRRQNREEYSKRQQGSYRSPVILDESPPIRREPERVMSPPGELPRPQAKNKYGDAWSQ
ncbi:OCIA domain-containing protein 1 isoform X2 [Toxorhynchites rutilus septentrionalis]|uniref:OCIA domain-containing protein 1 isoform X2 n=1 Tax=Toxorhynchites rutilus septentrionalis TaxID=329112 RepID=UPI002479B8F7|nr:OCIA domain-containing protein 1 isoform X2 [Toxorhynchites rutilus septentrionalis]